MFNKRLKMLREESGMTQKEVAEKIIISPRVYAYYETERFPKDEETIKKLAILFNCTTDYLLGASDFKNHEEAKGIHESVDVFKQIEDPQVLEHMKDILNTLADIGKSTDEKSYVVTHCFYAVANSLHEILSFYHSSVEKTEGLVPKGLQDLKFFEFKSFSMEKIDSVQESIKEMANDLANRIKESLGQDDDKVSL